MTRSVVHIECDFCQRMADYRLSAQWTIFDWDHAYVCVEHVPAGYRSLDHLVDGQPVLEWAKDPLRQE